MTFAEVIDDKESRSRQVTSQNVVTNEGDEDEEEETIQNDSDAIKGADNPALSDIDTVAGETDLSNKEKEDSVETKHDSETRGRKVTSVNFLPCDCKLCGEKFNSDKALGYHIRDVHVVGKKDKKEGEVNRKKKPKDYHYVRGKDWKVLNPKRPYCCSTCGKRFLYESSLNHHKVVKHNEKLDDNDGSTSSSIPPKMYNHTFQCDQCGKILMSKHSLIRHLVSFHGTDHEKPFQCDICGHRYVSISSLVSHRRKEHTGDKPYVCEHCGKAFTMSNRLKCHLRVHSDEKFYKCQQCSKQFKSCSAFRAHKDTHLGVMRHTCKYCGRKFLFQGNMIKHIRRRHPNGDKSGEATGDGDTSNGLINVDFASNDNNNDNVPNAGNLDNGANVNLSMTSDSGENVHHPATNVSSNSTAVAITVNAPSRRFIRPIKTVQASDHSYFTKEVTINVTPHSHLDVLEQQQQNMQNLSPLEHFVQPEIQFQVLPLSSLPNQELFNGINTFQSNNLNQTSTGTINVTGSGKCRLCDQVFSDIRFHVTDFHRIPVQKVDSMMPTMIYF